METDNHYFWEIFLVKTKPFLILLMLLMVTAGMTVVSSVLADDDICFKGSLDYTNNSGTDQTIYSTVYDPATKEVKSGSKKVTTVSPGETYDDPVERNADPDKHLVFIYSTSPIDENNIVYFNASVIDPCFLFHDGRLNWMDAAAPAIVYNYENLYYDIYAVNPNTGNGTRVMRVPFTAVTKTVESAVAANQYAVIQQAVGITIYALSSGTCQMNVFQPDGKLYEFEWVCVTT